MSDRNTATTHGAREHARAQAGEVAEGMPTLPASSWPDPPAGIDPGSLVWAETIAAGGYSSKVFGRGALWRVGVPPRGRWTTAPSAAATSPSATARARRGWSAR